jgi:predicted nucleic acid-binding protein
MPNATDIEATVMYVFNASSLINLERAGSLRVLDKLAQNQRLVIPDRVAREVNAPRKPLENWLRRNRRSVTDLLPQESSLYLQYLRQTHPKIHDGEAAALAVAAHRGCTVVVDDRSALQKAAEHNIPHLTSGAFLRRLLF